MNPTIQFLWDRRRRNHLRELKTSVDWAIHLLQEGYESDAIFRLAGITESAWDGERKLVNHALHDIGRQDLLMDQNLIREFEREIIADYYAGRITGPALIDLGIQLYDERDDERADRYFWPALSEDAWEHGQGLCCRYRFDLLPFDVFLKQALAEYGFPEPSAQ